METKEKFRGFLKRWMDDNWKGNQSSFARYLGISKTNLSNILNGYTGTSEIKRIKICNILGVDYRSLIDVEMYPKKIMSEIDASITPRKFSVFSEAMEQALLVQVNSQRDKEHLNGISANYRGIPLYESGKLAAGINGCEFNPFEEPSSMVIVYKPELQGCHHHRLLALRVGGESMKPTVTQDSIVVVDMDNKEYFDLRIYAICLHDDGEMFAAVKRVRKWQSGFMLVSDNPDYPPEPVASDWNELCVGRVVWQLKNMMDS